MAENVIIWGNKTFCQEKNDIYFHFARFLCIFAKEKGKNENGEKARRAGLCRECIKKGCQTNGHLTLMRRPFSVGILNIQFLNLKFYIICRVHINAVFQHFKVQMCRFQRFEESCSTYASYDFSRIYNISCLHQISSGKV